MHTLIVVSHPDPASLSHAAAHSMGSGIVQAGPEHSYEVADLYAEGFDPRFNVADHALHRRTRAAPADVAAEQARIDRADALALVFPVYWWSMPALMKGWIDRVFSNGWAYDDTTGRLEKKLGRLPVYLVGVGGADARTYARHGYASAMRTQIDHGIFDYCGARVMASELLLHSHDEPDAILAAARRLGRRIAEAPVVHVPAAA